LTGAYKDACDSCWKTNAALQCIDWNDCEGRKWIACDRCNFHAVRPRGDPTTDLRFTRTFDEVQYKLGARHHEKGALHMTVMQVRQLRKHILSKGGKHSFMHFQMWVMSLVAIRCFLRAEEAISLELDFFRTECTVLHEESDRIDEIVLKVKGKSDTEWQHLSIFRDDENPEFCALRALLVYLAQARITGGMLFPNYEDLIDNLQEENKNPTEAFPDHYSYDKFLKNLKVSFRNVFMLHVLFYYLTTHSFIIVFINRII